MKQINTARVSCLQIFNTTLQAEFRKGPFTLESTIIAKGFIKQAFFQFKNQILKCKWAIIEPSCYKATCNSACSATIKQKLSWKIFEASNIEASKMLIKICKKIKYVIKMLSL